MSTVVFIASAVHDMTFGNLFPKSTITVVLKNIFAGFLSRYFEEIELTLSFFAAEYCAMTSER